MVDGQSMQRFFEYRWVGRLVGVGLVICSCWIGWGCRSMHQGLDATQGLQFEAADGLGEMNTGLAEIGDQAHHAMWQW